MQEMVQAWRSRAHRVEVGRMHSGRRGLEQPVTRPDDHFAMMVEAAAELALEALLAAPWGRSVPSSHCLPKSLSCPEAVHSFHNPDTHGTASGKDLPGYSRRASVQILGGLYPQDELGRQVGR